MRKSKLTRPLLTAAMLSAMMMPTAAYAQNGQDNFFSDYDNGNRAGANEELSMTFSVGTQTYGEDLPLGNGVAILVASAAGYALLKRRKQQDSETLNNTTK